MKGTLFALPAFVAAVLLGAAARADTISYSGFSNTSGLTLNGDASTATTGDGTVLRVSPAVYHQHGSAFTNSTVDVSRFSTHFTFRISNAGGISIDDTGETGADGLTFTVQSNAPGALGDYGSGIGYAGISNSVAVEFDTWHNPEVGDINSNHVGVDINGSVLSTNQTAVLGRFDDGNLWHAWIDYDGITLQVRANETGVRPAAPVLVQAINIPLLTGGDQAYVGFTSAGYNAWGDHDVVGWQMNDATAGPAVPLPGVAWAGLALLGGVGAKRLRRRATPIA
jgi:hypothetical protein